jgi:hypothetical protein
LLTFFAEDSIYLAGFFILVAATCLIQLKVTQDGRYLLWALGALGMAALTYTVERLWVTDTERIKQVVYDLRKAVAYNSVQGVLDNLTTDVEFVQGATGLPSDLTRELIRVNLANATFDLISVQDMQISVGRQTRRGKAEFRLYAKGTLKTSRGTCEIGASSSTWSLGFQETGPGHWKVNRITPISVPGGMTIPAQLSSSMPNGNVRRGHQPRVPTSPAPRNVPTSNQAAGV